MSKKLYDCDIADKLLVSVEELSALTGIGVNRLRDQILRDPEIRNRVVLNVGAKTMIKMDNFRDFIRDRHEL